ncbi:hypothetical protein ANS017_26290 [Paraclostridium bifermentans]|nr:hypothetical protein ANS014_24920 [Paraclostridium bifermentans]GKZ05567.1 hypothetical protein ANS015_04500 [Paraclostridium bifermentans]GKZ11245.1 hypothetical protein ANS017_26290 [Paraclostridium bifermentans]
MQKDKKARKYLAFTGKKCFYHDDITEKVKYIICSFKNRYSKKLGD